MHFNSVPGCTFPNSDAKYGGGTVLLTTFDVEMAQCQRLCREYKDCIGVTFLQEWEWWKRKCSLKSQLVLDGPTVNSGSLKPFCGCKIMHESNFFFKPAISFR